MRERGTLLLSVVLLGGLAAGSYWLAEQARLGDLPTRALGHDIDYTAEDITLTRMDETGRAQYVVDAKKLVHYYDDDTGELTLPHLVGSKVDRPEMRLRADRGVASDDNQEVRLYGNVVMNREPWRNAASMVAKGSYMLVYPEREVLSTDQPVSIIQGGSTMEANAMHYDNGTRQVRFGSDSGRDPRRPHRLQHPQRALQRAVQSRPERRGHAGRAGARGAATQDQAGQRIDRPLRSASRQLAADRAEERHDPRRSAALVMDYADAVIDEPVVAVDHEAPQRAASGAARSVFEASHLKKTYGKRTVVHDVSLKVGSGEVVGLLGPNGAGKTTCFYMMLGLVGADAGSITLDGNSLTRLPIHRRARLGLSYLPQEASVFRQLDVQDNIRAVLELQRGDDGKALPKVEIDRRLEALLEDLQITHLKTNSALSLSGGERRRVEIARALATSPRFILLDEPFAGIDPIAVIEIQRIVRFLKSRDIGVLITDHNVRETLGICDRAYIINAGAVLASGRPDEIIKDEGVRRVYLGEHFKM